MADLGSSTLLVSRVLHFHQLTELAAAAVAVLHFFGQTVAALDAQTVKRSGASGQTFPKAFEHSLEAHLAGDW